MQVIMKGKLIPVFVLAALVSCSQPPVKEQGPRPVKLADVTSLNMVEKMCIRDRPRASVAARSITLGAVARLPY